jgi:hypothetical protein
MPADAITEPENRIVYVAPQMIMKMYFKYYSFRSGVPSIYVADENVVPSYWGYTMEPHLKEIITLKASQLYESGISANNMKSRFLEDFRMKPEEIGPQVLTMQHLEAGFVVIACLLAFSVAVFALEVAPILWRKMLAWLEKAIFCCVVVKFTRINKLM